MADSIRKLERDVIACERCERLVSWCREVAREKRRAFREHEYWGKPVPSFGDSQPKLLIVGLAPGAHGANRTGRPFTGDGAGPFLYGALHRAKLATKSESLSRDDGLELVGVRITNAVRCAPPGNRPTPTEAANCRPFLVREFELVGGADGAAGIGAILALGAFAWSEVLATLAERGAKISRPSPRFGHGAECDLGAPWPFLIGSYHPSQQNTNTGRLTARMFDEVLERARSLSRRRTRSRG